MKIHFVDQSTMPKGQHASDALARTTSYAIEEMSFLPRKDDTIVLQSRPEPFASPKEYHTVWAIYIILGGYGGVEKIISVGHRHIL